MSLCWKSALWAFFLGFGMSGHIQKTDERHVFLLSKSILILMHFALSLFVSLHPDDRVSDLQLSPAGFHPAVFLSKIAPLKSSFSTTPQIRIFLQHSRHNEWSVDSESAMCKGLCFSETFQPLPEFLLLMLHCFALPFFRSFLPSVLSLSNLSCRSKEQGSEVVSRGSTFFFFFSLTDFPFSPFLLLSFVCSMDF